MSCPSIWATPICALLINILLGSGTVVFAQWSASLWGWNNPVQRCLPVGGRLHYPRRRRWWLHALTDRLLWYCNRRRPAATSSRRASFSALSAIPFVYFASGAATSRWRICMSVIAAFADFSSLAFFVALGFVGNGVITVMINSPWQADDDADNQSGDNHGDSAHTSISLTVPPASFEFCNQAVSLMLELTITSAQRWSPDIATVDCLTDITTINHR